MANNNDWSLANFKRRFSARELGFKDIDPLSIRLGAPLLVFSLLGALAIDSESGTWGTPMSLAIAVFLFLSYVTVLYLLSFHSNLSRFSAMGRLWMLVWPIFLSGLLTLMSTGLILWINVFFGSQDEVLVSGYVVERDVGGGRYTGKDYYLAVNYDQRKIRLAVSEDEYFNHPLGSRYEKQMTQGGLGLYYVLGIGAWK